MSSNEYSLLLARDIVARFQPRLLHKFTCIRTEMLSFCVGGSQFSFGPSLLLLAGLVGFPQLAILVRENRETRLSLLSHTFPIGNHHHVTVSNLLDRLWHHHRYRWVILKVGTEKRKQRNDYEYIIFRANSFEPLFRVEQTSAAAESRAEALTNSIIIVHLQLASGLYITYNVLENVQAECYQLRPLTCSCM